MKFPPSQDGAPNLPDDTPNFTFFRIAPVARHLGPRSPLPTTFHYGLAYSVAQDMLHLMAYDPNEGCWVVDEEDEIDLGERDIRILLKERGVL